MIFSELLGMDFDSDPQFNFFWLNDVNPHSQQKKKRQIAAPNPNMRVVHKKLIRYLRGLRFKMPNSTSCQKGSSPYINVLRHYRHRFFYLVDLRNAYGSVTIEKLIEALITSDPKLRGYEHVIIEVAQKFLINQSGQGLVTGAPASPDLFNLYTEVHIDAKIRELLERQKIIYTRYLDDLTFSSPYWISEKTRRDIRSVIEHAGFKVNHWKSKVLDVRKKPIVVNGLGLMHGGRIFVPRHVVREVNSLIYKAMMSATLDRKKMAEINGKMSPIIFLAKKNIPNKIEQKVLRNYRALHARMIWEL